MSARTVVGLLGLAVLIGVGIYLLLQIPAVFAIGGIVALAAILVAIGHDAPDAL
jgi:hypothetical protein